MNSRAGVKVLLEHAVWECDLALSELSPDSEEYGEWKILKNSVTALEAVLLSRWDALKEADHEGETIL